MRPADRLKSLSWLGYQPLIRLFPEDFRFQGQTREVHDEPSSQYIPGEVLLEEFLVPMGLSQSELARTMHVPPRRVNEIVLGRRAVTADTALRLARALGTSERFWLGLQDDYDLEEARLALDDELNTIARAAA